MSYSQLNSALTGRYTVERELGAGGMATVYLAQDIRHHRKVALKVLRPELSAILGADRFLAEIKTTANLQHPHILSLFDSGEADGTVFYVMPYVEGETLRDRIKREQQLPIDDAVRIAREVLDALEYAHEQGIVHRDIKPENILLHGGHAMVADFGIALAASKVDGGTRMTETGMSLGTPHYMSPEQAMGERVITGKADVYALGAVLYEMLTGEPPFTGQSAQAVFARVLTDEPRSLTLQRKTIPPHVEAAVQRALEKLPADRFESALAFADALGNATLATGYGRRTASRTREPSGWRERIAIPALVLSAVLAVVAVWSLLRPPRPQPISRYEVALPQGLGIASTNWSPLAVSPDGSKLVYMGETGRLVLRSRDLLDPVEIPGTESGFNPFFSHDGRRVGFLAGAAGSADIKIAVLGGGPPTSVISTGVGGPGAAFGYDGYIYFDASGVGPLRRVRETGGDAEDASVRDSAGGELQHNWPEPLPNGRGVLMVIDRAGPGVNVATINDIAVIDLATKKHRVLMRGVYARYTTTGHILYVTSGGVLMAVPFDQDRMELTGTPVALRDGITVRRGGGGVDLAISETGTLWYGLGSNAFRLEAAWVTRTGVFSQVAPGWTGDFGNIALSPDGARLALSIVDATGEQIWVKNLASPDGALSKLTFKGVNQVPRWHPDGTRLLFAASFLPSGNIQSVRSDGTSAAPEPLVKVDTRTYMASWSRDGQWIAFELFGQGSGRDIAAVRTTADTAVVRLLNTPFSERVPSISPDGRWMMYQATTTGIPEVYVRPFPNASSGLYQVSSGGGTYPKWSRDGREIFFVNANNELTRVAVTTGTSFATSDQRVLFSLRGVADWDVGPDANRFITIREREGRPRSKLVVVENFFEELRTRVPR
jgi:eukaryotic-like serine/threonine-protein kinase